MGALYTIGFTQTTAEDFFGRLSGARVGIVLDVRLHRVSQLAGFARYPDIAYFLRALCGIEYLYDELLASSEEILNAYRKKQIEWPEYERRFDELMEGRQIDAHIARAYAPLLARGICLLCSERRPETCHRRLLAERFARLFSVPIVHL